MLAWRHVALAVALGATVLASFVELPDDKASVSATPATRARSAPSAVQAVQAAPTAAAASVRPKFEPLLKDLFAVHNWQPVAKPVMAAATRPIAVAAPPLPFRYIGKLVQDGSVTAFLEMGNATHVLRAGDLVAGYRVDAVSESGIDLTYLRLNDKQHMSFGNTP